MKRVIINLKLLKEKEPNLYNNLLENYYKPNQILKVINFGSDDIFLTVELRGFNGVRGENTLYINKSFFIECNIREEWWS